MKQFSKFVVNETGEEFLTIEDVMKSIHLDSESIYNGSAADYYDQAICDRIDEVYGSFDLFGTSFSACEVADEVCPHSRDEWIEEDLIHRSDSVRNELVSMMSKEETNERFISFYYSAFCVTAVFEDDNILSKDIYVLVIIKDGDVVFHDYFNDIDSTYKMKEYFVEEQYASLGLPETDYATKENIIRKIGYSFNNLPMVVSFDPETDK